MSIHVGSGVMHGESGLRLKDRWPELAAASLIVSVLVGLLLTGPMPFLCDAPDDTQGRPRPIREPEEPRHCDDAEDPIRHAESQALHAEAATGAMEMYAFDVSDDPNMRASAAADRDAARFANGVRHLAPASDALGRPRRDTPREKNASDLSGEKKAPGVPMTDGVGFSDPGTDPGDEKATIAGRRMHAGIMHGASDHASAWRECPKSRRPHQDGTQGRPAPRIVPVNPFLLTERDPLSTFALETDTASYAQARRYIRSGVLPPVASVRVEEYINYFDYNYPRRTHDTFDVHATAAPSPFGRGLVLLKIGVRGKVRGREGLRPAHLVFVVDASGSMDRPDRIPLVQDALKQLVRALGKDDRVSLVLYGAGANLVLEAGPAGDQEAISRIIDAIRCHGATNMIQGLTLGYQIAQRHFRSGAINRVILCSDGIANVGLTQARDILDKIGHFRAQGITFTGAGFGGGVHDALLEDLSNQGDGNYVFVDTPAEARRVFVDQMAGTLQTIARDVKIQVLFHPACVRRYRLIGYENRDIADEDFRNDAVDAGEVGSGQSATALYEIELHDAGGMDLGTIAIRYKDADDEEVHEISKRLRRDMVRPRTVESDPRFFLAACAAEFAEILRGREHAADGDLQVLAGVLQRVVERLPMDQEVRELLQLVRSSRGLPRAR